MTTGFLYDERFLRHDAGAGHPERKERLERSIAYLRDRPWFGDLEPVTTRRAEPEWVQAIHSPELMRRAEAACAKGLPFLDVGDVGISSESFEKYASALLERR